MNVVARKEPLSGTASGTGSGLPLEDIWEELRGAEYVDTQGYFILFFSYVIGAIRRNALITLSAVFLLSLAVFLSGSILLLSKPFSELLFSENRIVPIKVYVESPRDEIRQFLNSFSGVETVEFVSGADALRALRVRLGSSHPLFQGIALDEQKKQLLPDRYLITVHRSSDVEDVFFHLREEIKGQDGVERVSLQSAVTRQLHQLSELFSRVGVLFSSASFLGAMLLVMLVVQLRFFLRADEVRVMRLVGATRQFVVIPLYLESLLIALLAGVIGVGAISFLEKSLFQDVVALYPAFVHRPDAFALSLGIKILLCLAAILIASLGTWCSISFFSAER